MLCNCRPFDKVKDMQEVDQFGYVDLCNAYANGAISGDLAVETGKMNGIEHPEAILGKPSDEFDAIALNKVVRERGVKSETKDAAPASE